MANYQNPNIPSQNTPKGLIGDASQIPSSYRVETFLITNQRGETYDIRNLVVSFTITEEIFSPIVVLNARLRDTINFFEDFGISGQEIIKIKLKKIDGTEKPQTDDRLSYIELTLTVKEYPNYQKSTETLDVQEYNMIAISEFAYLSALQRISRSVHGNPSENIKKIFVDDLNVKASSVNININNDTKYPCVTTFDGVITIQSPLKAVEWLRMKSFDSKGAPFFVYTTIRSNHIHYRSWSSLIDDDNRYPNANFTYKFKAHGDTNPLTDDSYAENMGRILSMTSNIKLDKLAQATSGGFANKVQITDFGVKTFTEKIFGIDRDKIVMDNRLKRSEDAFKYTEWGQAFGFLSGATNPTTQNSLDLSKLSNASISQISTLSGSANASSVYDSNLATAKSYLANMQSETHEIVLYGDFRLNPGRKIAITIPKSTNIKEYNEKINPKQTVENVDLRLSGEYVVAIAVHMFQNGVYTTRAKIIRDNT